MTARTAAVCTAAAGTGFFLEELYRYIFCRHGNGILFRVSKGNHCEAYYHDRDAAEAALAKLPCREYTITSCRGHVQKGFYYQWGEKPSRLKAFLVHGYRSEYLQTAGLYYDYYRSRGIDLFCCDHEAHGRSDGEIIGYDHYESQDCLKWIDFLQQEFGPDTEIILHGFSMGGGTVLKMSDRVPDCVRFIIDDCGYSSAADILKPSLGPFYYAMDALNRCIGGYSLQDTDVRQNLQHARVPILFVHGTLDETVPYRMTPGLFALCPTAKDRLYVEGARHVESMWLAPDRYSQKIDEFIRKYTN